MKNLLEHRKEQTVSSFQLYFQTIQSFWFKLPIYLISFGTLLYYDFTNDAFWLVMFQAVWLNINTVTYMIYSLFVVALDTGVIPTDMTEDDYLKKFHRLLKLKRINHWAKVTACILLFTLCNMFFPFTFISLALQSIDVKTKGRYSKTIGSLQIL
jgi:hypothetical protein